MTAETYLMYAPLTLLSLGALVYAVLSVFQQEPRRELNPVRVLARRRRDLNR